MTLSGAHTSAKAADVAKMSLVNKRRVALCPPVRSIVLTSP